MKQDRRSKNRYREHSGEDHELRRKEGAGRAAKWPGHVLMYCTCGWLGWIIPAQ